LLHCSSPSCPVKVSFAGYAVQSTPSPCMWLSHTPSTMSESDSHTVFSHPSFGWVGLPVAKFRYLLLATQEPPLLANPNKPSINPGTTRVSQVLIISLCTCHAFKHRQILQNLTLTILLYGLPSTRQRRHLLSRSYDAKTASGMCVSPVTYAVLCVRFA
jgi:hypothetical protein